MELFKFSAERAEIRVSEEELRILRDALDWVCRVVDPPEMHTLLCGHPHEVEQLRREIDAVLGKMGKKQ